LERVMNIGITLKNYRCFPEDQPATFRLEKGFTALVGSNNAGKSTLLKFFWEFRGLFDALTNTNALMSALQAARNSLNFASTIRDQTEVFSNRNGQGLTVEFDFTQIDANQLPAPQAPFPTRLVVEFDRATKTWVAKAYINESAIPSNPLQFTTRANTTLVRHEDEDVADLAAILTMAQKLKQCLYIPAYRNAINVGATQPYFDIQTGQAFIAQWRAWRAGDLVEHRRAARRLTDTIRDIFKYDHLEVNAANNNETLELSIDDQSYLLPELGSGIAQFFIVLANAAIKKPSFVLIDEPELNLHPSLQRDFLQCLASYATEGVVFATHNLGLALVQANRVYSVRRIAHGRSQVCPYSETPRLSEFLGELSFAGYKQLGFDKLLLVEGVTDMGAIQHFLSLYGKQDKVVLLPLGGNVLINGSRKEELQEVLRICPRVFALIDSEKQSASAVLEKPRQDFVAVCESLSPPIPCKVLDRRSTENYFTDAAVKAALGPGESALAPYAQAPKRWKDHNWRIAQEMDLPDINTTDLGTFLASL
jgi:ABC-type Mn2+/Zn2+ transport system ATPase subunit